MNMSTWRVDEAERGSTGSGAGEMKEGGVA